MKITIILLIALSIFACSETKDEKMKTAIGLINSGSYERALYKLKEILELDSNSSQAYYYTALAFEGLEEYEKALRNYTKSIELKPNFTTAYHSRAKLNFKLRYFRDVIKDLTIVLSMYNNDTDAYIQRGRAFYEMNELNSACNDWQQAAQMGSIDAMRLIDKLCNDADASSAY